jgi:hypothetical protein
MRAAVFLAGLLGGAASAFPQNTPRPASTIVVEQVSASGRRLRQAVLTCPGDRCEHVVQLDADGASFGMAMRIHVDSHGARFIMRGCEPSGTEADCGLYGTSAADRLTVPLGADGFGSRTFTIARIPPAVLNDAPGLEAPVLRRESNGLRFHMLIEVARQPR